MADIFLSYAKEDRARVKIIAELLKSCGWSVFWDAGIKASADWREVLQSELDKAGAVVVLWSDSSVASTWVKEEAERGRERLISVRLDEVDLPLGFSGLQGINLIGWRGGNVDEVGKFIQAAGHEVSLEMRFIGLAVSAEDEARLRELSGAVAGQAYFVNTTTELNDVLQNVLEFEPAVTHVKEVWEVVDRIGRSISDVAENMNQRKFDEAQSILEAARASYLDNKPSFDALAGRQLTVNFERFYTLAAENRSLQEQALALGRVGVRLGRASVEESQSPAYAQSITAWNEVVQKYNANINEMNQLTDEIVKEARTRGEAGP